MERSHQRPKWRIEDEDSDMLQAMAIVAAWNRDARREKTSVTKEVKNLRRDTNTACDTSMPRSVPDIRENPYWWTSKITNLRTSCNRARRRLQRARGRRHPDEEEIALRCEVYKRERYALRQEIKRVKAQYGNYADPFQSDESVW